jgi:hypothetical protein
VAPERSTLPRHPEIVTEALPAFAQELRFALSGATTTGDQVGTGNSAAAGRSTSGQEVGPGEPRGGAA